MARKKDASSRLDAARAAHAETTRQIGEIEARRNAALLADDDATAAQLGSELETLRRHAWGCRDKIGLLKVAAEREAAQKRAKARLALIERIEVKQRELGAVAAELQAVIAQEDRLFRRAVTLAEGIGVAWPFSDLDRQVALLTPSKIVGALQSELYRIGARPYAGGTPGARAEPSLPGGACPDHRLRGTPEKLPTLVAAFAEASTYASAVMRNGHASGAVALPPPGSAPSAPLTEAEARLARLLKQQSALAEDISPAGEEKYMAVVAEIAALSADAEKRTEPHNG